MKNWRINLPDSEYELEITTNEGEHLGTYSHEHEPRIGQTFTLHERVYKYEMIIHPRNTGLYICDVSDQTLIEERAFENLMENVAIPDEI